MGIGSLVWEPILDSLTKLIRGIGINIWRRESRMRLWFLRGLGTKISFFLLPKLPSLHFQFFQNTQFITGKKKKKSRLDWRLLSNNKPITFLWLFVTDWRSSVVQLVAGCVLSWDRCLRLEATCHFYHIVIIKLRCCFCHRCSMLFLSRSLLLISISNSRLRNDFPSFLSFCLKKKIKNKFQCFCSFCF